MFWKKKIKVSEPLYFEAAKNEYREAFPYPERHCWLYISDKYKEVLFVPMGKIDQWKSKELDSIIVGEWPMSIGDLQKNIIQTLDKWQDPVENVEPSIENWHSFNISKARSQKSFKVDYVQISLTTDMEREYGQSEVERIVVKASPFDWTEDRYNLIGKSHLLETQVSQVVIDIYKACDKIRTK